MDITAIKQQLNQHLAGEQLTTKQMLIYINRAIDEINSELNATFPIIADTDTTYTAIPDKYIRTVVIPGAVHYYYVVDDEGSTGEQDFYRMYQDGKFRMLRDYSHDIPSTYQDDEDNGTIEHSDDGWGVSGIWL